MTNDRRGDAIREIAERIMRYLYEHADAADAAEGVARWWLGGEPVESIEAAMALLAHQGLVETNTLPDGTVVYRSARGTRPPDSQVH